MHFRLERVPRIGQSRRWYIYRMGSETTGKPTNRAWALSTPTFHLTIWW